MNPDFQNKRLLVVEDNPELENVFQLFGKLCNAEIIYCTDPVKAADKLAEWKDKGDKMPDAVITDMAFSHTQKGNLASVKDEGIEDGAHIVMDALREVKCRAPVFIFSGLAADSFKKYPGHDATIVSKPIPFNKLFSTVHNKVFPEVKSREM